MKILITGNTGYVGRALTQVLASEHIIIPSNSKKNSLLYPNRICCFEDPYDIDCIVHLAAWTKAGDFCLTHQAEQWVINQQINTNIVDFWLETCPKARFIGVGTSCGYAPDCAIKRPENYMVGEPSQDLISYAMTKRMLLYGLRAAQLQHNMVYSYLIPNTIYGPNFELSDTHFIFDLIKKICDAKYGGVATPVLWGSGNQKRELVFIDDVIIRLKNHILNTTHLCIEENVAPGVEYSIRDYAKLICNYIRYDFNKINFDTSKFEGQPSKVLSVPMYDELYHYVSLSDGIAKTIDYYIKEKGYAL